MTRLQMTVRAILLALAGMTALAGAAAAANGDGGGGDSGVPLWLGMAVVAAFLAVVYQMVRQPGPDLTAMDIEEREEGMER